jgi:hypothetical protein
MKNEPAFPQPDPIANEFHQKFGTDRGMTLRDYFAAKAMPSIVSYFLKEEFHLTDHSWMEGVAMDAYKMADVMLKARGE